MKKIDFRQRAAKTEERKRKSKYADVMVRATVMGLMKPDEDVDRMMDIESADKAGKETNRAKRKRSLYS